MNYKKIYEDLISKAKSENRKRLKNSNKNYVYYELHHIIPKSLGGSDLKENKILLTAKEHFICHKLLVEIYPEEKKLIYAVFFLSVSKGSSGKRDYVVGAREYERIKTIVAAQWSKDRSGENNSNFGNFWSQEKKDQKSKDMKGLMAGEKNPRYKANVTQETRNKIGDGNRGKVAANKGVSMSKIQVQKLINIAKNREKVECPYCGAIMDKANAYRWHFDNCKKNPDNNELEIIKFRRDHNPNRK